ncbi:MAG TPA: T9SS type A sorting domain-containing protein [Saprospiraceae bacterium]|jgi:hypothetical protein|nr:MAG: hypothetical protein UZ08_BCD001001891 [Candidatus Parvibacillus calidus]MBX2936397.1 T9SS type A sorting domain-containing protein [Saprospiraceae bacterium]MBK7739206.1 T9SS type A sorting domain-containing protein [Candidatus Parvibacillus calidus]MCB0592080.1 T9SS type A sorting domain-containing protein [Saprospiraceae bacterium]MCC7149276.1 T9SS type A sorting domain-containing protein [Saprospiraceae bacterium]
MKFFTFLLCFFLFSTVANAQTFKLAEDSMSTVVEKDEFENYIQNFAFNLTTETKVLRWTQKTIFKGSQWSNSQVCDNNLCYTDKILSKTVEVPAGGNTLLKLLFRPNGQDTCGYYTITIKEEGKDNDEGVAHYFFNGTDCEAVASGLTKISNVETVRIYPNPAKDYVQLSSLEAVKNIAIYNTEGRLIKEIMDYRNGLIPVNDLNRGTYFMMLSFHNGKLGVSKLFKD